MKKFQYVIKEPVGIHARPAGLLMQKALEYKSQVTISCGGKSADAKKLLKLISLGAKQGMEVSCTIEGADEEAAYKGLRQFFADNL